MMLSHKIVVVITATYAFLHKRMVDAQIVGSTWSYSTSFETTPLGGGGLFNDPLGSEAKLTDGTNADATGANLRGGTPDFIPSATNQNLSPSVSAPRPSAPPVLAPAAPPIGLIAGGEPAGEGVFTYQVYLTSDWYIDDKGNNVTDYCGGSLLARDVILTAAHCLSLDLKFATLGAYDLSDDSELREKIQLCDQVQHPDYYLSDFKMHDVALLRLCNASELVNNGVIYPVMLNSNPDCPVEDYTVTVTGWGEIDNSTPSDFEELLKADLLYITPEHCASDYEEFGGAINPPEIITEDEMCTEIAHFADDKDFCSGDSGGAAVIGEDYTNFVEVGVVSHNDGGCPSDVPSVYSRVSASLDWILEFGCCLNRVDECEILWTDLCEEADREKANKGKKKAPKGGDGSKGQTVKPPMKCCGGTKTSKKKSSKPSSKPM